MSFVLWALLEQTTRDDLRNVEFLSSALFEVVPAANIVVVVVVLLSELNEVVVRNVVGELKPSQVVEPAYGSVGAIYLIVAGTVAVVTDVGHVAVQYTHFLPLDGQEGRHHLVQTHRQGHIVVVNTRSFDDFSEYFHPLTNEVWRDSFRAANQSYLGRSFPRLVKSLSGFLAEYFCRRVSAMA